MSPTSAIRAVLVDDEPLARERLRRLLADEADVRIVGVYGDAESAGAAIRSEPPDVLFLDVQMPEATGLDLLKSLGLAQTPLIVFVTAHPEHAVRAFEVGAVDYLLKPFSDERFAQSLGRVREVLRAERVEHSRRDIRALIRGDRRGSASDDNSLLHTKGVDTAPLASMDRLVVRSGSRLRLVKQDTIDWIEAENVYARLHVGRETHLLRIPLRVLEEQLDPRRFVRIHRSAIINVDRVLELRDEKRGEYTIVLVDGSRHRLSRSRKHNLERILGSRL